MKLKPRVKFPPSHAVPSRASCVLAELAEFGYLDNTGKHGDLCSPRRGKRSNKTKHSFPGINNSWEIDTNGAFPGALSSLPSLKNWLETVTGSERVSQPKTIPEVCMHCLRGMSIPFCQISNCRSNNCS